MTDYSELVKALRYCASDETDCKENCPYSFTMECLGKIKQDAAAAIEELQQIADHYEQTAKDYWKEACEYKAQLPKRGEWIDDELISKSRCSVCDEEWSWFDNCMETFNYCPNCGAKMEV